MVDAGVPFAISTDAPVASYRPFDTISTAMTRRTVGGAVVGEDHALSLADALRAYTAEAAASYHAEDRVGSLAPGLLADLVVVDGDLFATPPDRIPDLRIALTIVGGEVAYDAGVLPLRRRATSDSIS
jgi:predicted amidohydrolase YtcJ